MGEFYYFQKNCDSSFRCPEPAPNWGQWPVNRNLPAGDSRQSPLPNWAQPPAGEAGQSQIQGLRGQGQDNSSTALLPDSLPDRASSADSICDKIDRLGDVVIGGTVSGIDKSFKEALDDPLATGGRIIAGAGIGVALACLTHNLGLLGFAARTTSTALGAGFLLDLASKERLDSVSKAIGKTLDSPDNTQEARSTFETYVGKFAFDTGLMALSGMAAGGIKGVDCLEGWGSKRPGVGYLHFEKQPDGSSIAELCKDTLFRKSGTAASLELSSGFRHQWTTAPNILSRVTTKDGDLINFTDGSKLTVSPNSLLQFATAPGDNFVVFSQHMKDGVTMLEKGSATGGKNPQKLWSRSFLLTDGPCITQYPGGDVHVVHVAGLTRIKPDGTLYKANAHEAFAYKDFAKAQGGSLPKAVEISTVEDGIRLLKLENGSTIQVNKYGQVGYTSKSGAYHPF